MILVDSHCDTPSQVQRLRDLTIDNPGKHVDFPKLKRGGVDASFFALYTPASFGYDEAYAHVKQMIDMTLGQILHADSAVAQAFSVNDIKENKKSGIHSILFGMENSSPISDKLERVEEFKLRGVKYITLCHNRNNLVCDSCTDSASWNGLSVFGRELVSEMNRQGILIDLSHASDATFYDCLKLSKAPISLTHSCCRALNDCPRNATDEMISALSSEGGVMQVNFYPLFLDESFVQNFRSSGLGEKADEIEAEFKLDPSNVTKRERWFDILDEISRMKRPSYKRVIDHVEHVIDVGGLDCVGFGSDFDGVEVLPEGLDTVADFKILLDELSLRGYKAEEISKIAGGNFLRVLESVENAQFFRF